MLYFCVKTVFTMIRANNYKTVGVILLISLLFTSCFQNIYTTNIQDLTTYQDDSYIYALPRTCLTVECTAIRTIHIAGPYAYKASELLKLENVKEDDEINWRISNIKVQSCEEPDPEHFYSVNDKQLQLIETLLMQLSEKGLVINPSAYNFNEKSLQPTQVKETINAFTFDQPSVNYEGYKADFYNQLSYPAKLIDSKGVYEEAQVVADEILGYRSMKNELFITEDALFPQGDAAQAGVHLFETQEKDLLTLFTGITIHDTITRLFYICPLSKERIQRHTLFKFSEEEGFLDRNNDSGKSVVMEIEDLNHTEHLDNLTINVDSPKKKNMLFYRIPDKANVSILNGSIPVAKVQIPAYQLGTLVPYYVK